MLTALPPRLGALVVGACLALVLLALGAGLADGARAAEDPVIQSISPAEANFGDWVTIAGAHFGASPGQVTFAGAGGRRYRATTRNWSDARIEAQVPYNTVPGEVMVQSADGRVSKGFRFSLPCWDKPVIRQILPASAMRCELVKIIGCGFGDFQYEQVLSFNGRDATGRVVGNWSDTTLLVRVPDEATSGPVVVTNKRRVPSAGFPFRVRDDAPEWPRLPDLKQPWHSLDLRLDVGEQPELGPPRAIQVQRQHWQKIGDSVRSEVQLTVTWRNATTFSAGVVDPGGGAYTLEGRVDPAAGTLRVRHHDAWQVELWDNTSDRERKVCHYELGFTAELPLGKNAWDQPDFNVWAPRFGFGAAGAELGRRVQGLSYKQDCFIYNYAGQRLRRDGRYEFLGVDWSKSTLYHHFEGGGKNPCYEPNPKWEPLGQISGRVYARLPDSDWLPTFTGFPNYSLTAPLPGVPVGLFVTPPGAPRRELATTVADDDGRYRFDQVPMTTTLDLEVTLENHAAAPPPFRVTYRRAEGAARGPVTLRTAPFSNLGAPLLTKDLRFAAGAGASAVDADHLDDVAATYAHTWQAWQTAGELGLTLNMHGAKGEPIEIRTFSPQPGTFWHGDHNVGPTWGPLPISDNVHVNIEATEAAIEHGDRPMNREWHELGHHVQADIQGDMMPSYWVSNALSDTNHAGRLNPSTSDSWIEGFAEFFSALVARNTARDRQPGLYRTNGAVVNLDDNLTSFRVVGPRARSDEEMAVASLLWDLVDSARDAEDVRPMGVTQHLLHLWNIRLAQPLAPAAVRWPPTLYGDRIALEDRVLMLLVSEADKIAQARNLSSPNAAPSYGWIFDIHQLYRTLQTMAVGQDVGPSGLTALDELFVAHGFFADTAPQNLCYDRGELIGRTDNLAYTITTTVGTALVPARADRYSPAVRPVAYLRYDARDTLTGAPVTVSAFQVTVRYAPPYDLYTYSYEAVPAEPGRLALVAPDPIYPSTVEVLPRGERLGVEAPFQVSGETYWSTHAGGAGPDLLRHTFQVRREPVHLALPLLLRSGPPAPGPGGVTPPTATPPSSPRYAQELIRLINAERERLGRAALAAQAELTSAAAWYAADMAASGDYRADHSDRQGRTLGERLRAFGYTSEGHPRWQVSENIARGQVTPAELVAAWLDSPPHRANILDRDACEIGVAHARAADADRTAYWVADFGCRAAPSGWPEIPEPGPTTPAAPSATSSQTRAPVTDTATPTTASPSDTPGGGASPSPSASPTPGATGGSPSATPSPTAPVGWRMLYDDDFCDPASGWPSGDTDTARFGYLIGMGCNYRIQLKTAQRSQWVTPRWSLGEDYALTVSTYPLGSGAFGLLFGLSPARDRFYVYLIDTARRFALFRNDNGAWSAILPWTPSEWVDPEFGNSLRLESEAGGLGLYLDGHLLTGLSDGQSHAGEVGLYAETQVAGFDARFTRYRVETRP